MNGWLAFWKWVCIINVVLYYLIAIVLVPMAIRDVIILVRRLNISKNEYNKNILAENGQVK